MKKLFSLLLSGLFLLCLSARVNAVIFTFSQAESSNFRELYERGNSYMASVEPDKCSSEIFDDIVRFMPTLPAYTQPAGMNRISKGANFAKRLFAADSGYPAAADSGDSNRPDYGNYGWCFENLGNSVWPDGLVLELRSLNYYEIAMRSMSPENPGESFEMLPGLTVSKEFDDDGMNDFNTRTKKAGRRHGRAQFSAYSQLSPVPEPGSLLLIITGFLGLAGFARKRIVG